jgi:hypothetical protein
MRWEQIWHRISTAPVGTLIESFDGPLFLVQGGWSSATHARVMTNRRAGGMTVEQYRAAAGPLEWALLTSDGRGARRDGWCRCRPEPDVAAWVRYEVWAETGRTAHGFLCPKCRFIVQTG